MWTRGAAVCSLLLAVPSCSDEAALSRLPFVPVADPPASLGGNATPPAGSAPSADAPPPSRVPTGSEDAGPLPPPIDGGGVIAPEGPVDRGFAALSWASIPVLGASRYREASSYDRSETSAYPFVRPGNKDFNNWLAVCGDRPAIGYGVVVGGASCEPSLEGFLIAADDDGPGYVSRIFFTHSDFDPNAPQDRERIRIYVDDLGTPAYEGLLSDWKNGTTEPFVAPLVGAPSGSTVSYVPISYGEKLRVLLDDLSPSAVYYYQVNTRSSAATLPFRPDALKSTKDLGARLRRDARDGGDRTTWIDQNSDIAAGDAAALLDRKGPGTLQSLRIALEDASPEVLAALELRVTWDEQTTPAIALPLDALFGQRPKLASFDTLPMAVELSGTSLDMLLALPMPFATRVQVELANTGASLRKIHTRIEGEPGYTIGSGRLHATAQERRAPMATGTRFPVAELTGHGRYVGSVLLMEGVADDASPGPSPLNFLEGDDQLVIDGELAAHGTGTEDFLDGGWYFEDGPFSSPFAALLSISPASQSTGQVTAVRWQAPADAVDYQSSLSLSLEYGAAQPNTALHYASVAFSYQSQ